MVPARPGLLSGYRDEAEIADRGAKRLRVTFQHDDGFAPPPGGQRMGKPHDSRPDNCHVIACRHLYLSPCFECRAAYPRCPPARNRQMARLRAGSQQID
jgi:hypothetical protein